MRMMRVLLWVAVSVLLLLVGGIVGYRFGREDDGTEFRTNQRSLLLLDGNENEPVRLPAGVVLYGVRDPFAEKVTRFKAYFAIYDAQPVELQRISSKYKALNTLRPERVGTK